MMFARTIMLVALSIASVVGLSASATVSAATLPSDITIHYNNWGEAKPGALVSLGERTVANATYNVEVVTKNQESTHPNNDLIVSSGDQKVTVKDIESKPNVTLKGSGILTVSNGKVKTDLLIGSDGLYSTGVDLVLSVATCTTNPDMAKCQPKPEVKPEPKPETKPEVKPAATTTPSVKPAEVTKIASTGVESPLLSLLGAGSLVATATAYIRSRRS